MSRQLNLRVSDEFVEKLDRYARSTGRPMAAVLEAISMPALEAAEDDARFEAEALAAWEEYQMDGRHATAGEISGLFDAALARAEKVAKGKKP